MCRERKHRTDFRASTGQTQFPWDAREITDSAATHVAAQRLPSKIDTVLERKEKENTSFETKIQNIHFPLLPVFFLWTRISKKMASRKSLEKDIAQELP